MVIDINTSRSGDVERGPYFTSCGGQAEISRMNEG
jgi:hypothetical protein